MADISHELRTPLALLRAEIEAMQDGIRASDEAQLNKLHHSVMQFSRLVDDLYDLALADAGALSYHKAPLNLAEVLIESAASAEHRISQKGLKLRLEIADRLPVFGDARRLRQVADNLLKNSRRYTDSGGEIRLSAWRAGRQVYFKIEDSAPGVAQETLARLFDRFYRAEESRSRAGGGAGLGLAICRNIVEAHQGSISAKVSPLGGLQIVVSLPMDKSISDLSPITHAKTETDIDR
jgi:two-component system sensor histidine kinase BaeS